MKKSILIVSLVLFSALICLSYAGTKFENQKLYMMDSTFVPEKKTFTMLIGHRANLGLMWEDNLLGLDGAANVHLELSHACIDNLQFSLSRSSTKRIYHLGAKFDYLNQFYKGTKPFESVFLTSVSLPTSDGYEKDVKANFQVLNSRLFLDRFEVFVPFYFTLNSNDLTGSAEDDHTFSVGTALRALLIENLYFVGEFAYPVWGFKNAVNYDSDGDTDWLPFYSASIQFQHYSHIFQVGVSNASGLVQDEFIGGGDKEVRFGFNVIIPF